MIGYGSYVGLLFLFFIFDNLFLPVKIRLMLVTLLPMKELVATSRNYPPINYYLE